MSRYEAEKKIEVFCSICNWRFTNRLKDVELHNKYHPDHQPEVSGQDLDDPNVN